MPSAPLSVSRLLAIMTMLASFSWPAHADRTFGAVTDEILIPEIDVLVGRAHSRRSDGRVRFTFDAALHGTLRPEVDLRLHEATRNRLTMGATYVVALTDYRVKRLFRDELELDPEGPRVVPVALVNDLVLADRPEIRRLIAGRNASTSIDRQLDDALALLESGDVFAQRFAALELYGRAALREAADLEAREQWGALLHAGAVDAMAQDFLFRAALRLASEDDHGWIADGARDVLTLTELPVEMVSAQPALLATALDALGRTGTAADTPRLALLLRAGHANIANAALTAMDTLDRPSTVTLAHQLLQTGTGDKELRRSLRAYVNRWDP